ncbi:MAG TPA: RdgB/HAM1 family non-canonical purine NTP pyrophosphatase [Gammaproteobacteria bacterium]|nr:RdgB/HAM1 family non-canonical purine NTP pyrophosphatase [Gammaproteobacteria bacterium]
MKKIVLATGNAGKVREMNHLLTASGIELMPQTELGVPEAEETGLTFVENAIIKARNACRHTGLPAIADDSGLVVDALHGAPGIYSSRYAGPAAGDADNNAKLLAELATVPEAARTARFCCAMVCLRHDRDPTPLISQGRWAGRILSAPQGRGGFGYDPLFFVPTHGCAAAQLPPEEKQRISHRGQALRALVALITHNT